MQLHPARLLNYGPRPFSPITKIGQAERVTFGTELNITANKEMAQISG